MKVSNYTKWITVFIFVFIVNLNTVSGLTFTVDCNGTGDFSTIQEAIDASNTFDTIIVDPGFYQEHIDYHNKLITIKSLDPNDPNIIDSTIIDGNDTGNVVVFHNRENEMCVLNGFTIQNGDIGIYCVSNAVDEVQINNCIIQMNDIGVKCSSGASVKINNAVITENDEEGTYECIGEFTNCIINKNGSTGVLNHSGTLTDCKITENNN